MSFEVRYRSLVNSIGRFYPELKSGLLDPVSHGEIDWAIVRADTRRLMAIWSEYAGYRNTAVEHQLMDMLEEFTKSPTLVVGDRIAHVETAMDVEEDVVPQPTESESESEDEDEEEVDEESEEESESEEEKEVTVSAVVADENVTVEKDEDEDEDEEEGMEVEQITVRGRKYFIDVKTKKLYLDDNEEVGDEVGSMVNGKPVFLAKK